MDKKLKNTQAILTITVGFLCLYVLFKKPLFLYVSAGIGLVSIFSDYARDGISLIWEKIGHVLGTINGKILLSIVFFLVLTPIALLMRIFGSSQMLLKKGDSKSYYTERNHLYEAKDMKNVF